MTALKQLLVGKSIFASQITRMMVLTCTLIILQSNPVQAQWTTNGNNINNTNAGSVGVGITNPQNSLDVSGSLLLRGNSGMSSPTTVGPVFNAGYYAAGGYAFSQGFNYTTLAYTPFYMDGVKVIINANSSGNVGIGTSSPNSQYKLDVNGNTNVSGNMNATGTITGGSINAKYQDVAEWVESSQALPAGTVVVLDHTRSNQVVSSTHSYDTRVAGVISQQPGIALGESGDNKVLVATTGRVRMKVDATGGPIHIGDLLVTSDTSGAAMKSKPLSLNGVELHRPGTLIGKALEPLTKGSGEILVLLSLQ
jgi:Peptidase_G2, IMC autoproteolytic cleavage domain